MVGADKSGHRSAARIGPLLYFPTLPVGSHDVHQFLARRRILAVLGPAQIGFAEADHVAVLVLHGHVRENHHHLGLGGKIAISPTALLRRSNTVAQAPGPSSLFLGLLPLRVVALLRQGRPILLLVEQFDGLALRQHQLLEQEGAFGGGGPIAVIAPHSKIAPKNSAQASASAHAASHVLEPVGPQVAVVVGDVQGTARVRREREPAQRHRRRGQVLIEVLHQGGEERAAAVAQQGAVGVAPEPQLERLEVAEEARPAPSAPRRRLGRRQQIHGP
ncbi:hypothetical protein PG994_013659 [Apiospora phragmitis]|uniref:Uncharacterized protein n=1 Tax=Apiospora phragmitis TaxID=2905665 RepID=A0ABR1TB17_9PEZI